jgi:ABC-2 type transport system ATP-binding protein
VHGGRSHRPHRPPRRAIRISRAERCRQTTTPDDRRILRPTEGAVRIAGIDIAADPVGAKSQLGFIPDRPFITKLRNEFLHFVAGLYGQAGPDVERRGRELLALFDLEPWSDELVESYSHGMRQKLIIASAFIHRPLVIVVDEPMVGLDPKAARILKDLFREYTRRGHTIMMSTHTMEVAQTLCDRVAIIQGGKIRAAGTIAELRAEATAGSEGSKHLPSVDRRTRSAGRRGPGCDARHRYVVVPSAVRSEPLNRPAGATQERRPPGIGLLLRPKLLTARARTTQSGQGRGLRWIALAVLAVAFWSAVFAVLSRLLRYFRAVPDLGPILAANSWDDAGQVFRPAAINVMRRSPAFWRAISTC